MVYYHNKSFGGVGLVVVRNKSRDFKVVGVFVGFVLVLGFLSVLALTGGRGLEDEVFTRNFLIYSVLAGIGLIGVVIFSALNRFGQSNFVVPIHDVEESVLSGVGWVRNPYLLSVLCLLVFVPVFVFIGMSKQTFFTQTLFTSQQITSFASVWGDSVFPAVAENLLFLIPLILLSSWVLGLRNRYASRFLDLFFVPLVVGLLWMSFHGLVYGSNEVALFSTFIFGFLGGFLTNVTKSFIPWLVLHFATNFSISLFKNGLFGNQFLLAGLLGLWVLFLVVCFGLFLAQRRGVRGLSF